LSEIPGGGRPGKERSPGLQANRKRISACWRMAKEPLRPSGEAKRVWALSCLSWLASNSPERGSPPGWEGVIQIWRSSVAVWREGLNPECWTLDPADMYWNSPALMTRPLPRES